MTVFKQKAVAQGLTPRNNETVKEFLCRLFVWVFEQEDIVSNIPWWIPTSLVKLALFKALGCEK